MAAGTYVSSAGATVTGFSVGVILSVAAGDVIVVSGVAFNNNGAGVPLVYTCTDSDGNDYGTGYWTAGPGFGQEVVFHARAEFDNAFLSITLTESVSRPHDMIASNFADVPPFDQVVYSLGPYVPSDSGTYPLGLGSAAFNIADTMIISCVNRADSSFPLPVSDSGDTHAFTWGNNQHFYRLEEYSPGDQCQQFAVKDTDGTSAVGNIQILSLIFSKPKARPDGVPNAAVRPGSGETDYNPAAQGYSGPENYAETNRPHTASLPYLPGVTTPTETVIAFVGALRASASQATTITDQYGNVYTFYGASPGFGGSSVIELWIGIINFVPTDGSVFRAKLTEASPVGGADYQASALGIQEHRIAGTPSGYRIAVWDHDDLNDPEQTMYTEVAPRVPAGTLLMGFAGWTLNATKGSINWTELDGWSIPAQWNLVQYDTPQTNDPRLAPCAIAYKRVAAAGAYDFSILSETIVDTYAEGGSLAMLAILVSTGFLPEYIRRRYL